VLPTLNTDASAIVFDGADLWTANYNSNNVTRLRASDGIIRGNYPVQSWPKAIAFDGANIWVVNQNSNSVSQLKPIR
jgi:outer membrane lipoprotein-sorting protein